MKRTRICLGGDDDAGAAEKRRRTTEDGATHVRKRSMAKHNHKSLSLNARSHPRTSQARYGRPDFEDLGKRYVSLMPFIIPNHFGRPTIDWKDRDALLMLTRVLLWHYHSLHFQLPPDHLCPTLTLRENYIHWIADLIKCRAPSPRAIGQEGFRDVQDEPSLAPCSVCGWNSGEYAMDSATGSTAPLGIDIGTGASCIYPLLGARIYGWEFLGTDIQMKALNSAHCNLRMNELCNKVHLFHSDGTTLMKSAAMTCTRRISFTMCNPPFFTATSAQQLWEGRTSTGNSDELSTEGGEIDFVTRLIHESVELANAVEWYTTMVGKKKTLKRVLTLLRETEAVEHIQRTTFFQGKTARWAVAWRVAQPQ